MRVTRYVTSPSIKVCNAYGDALRTLLMAPRNGAVGSRSMVKECGTAGIMTIDAGSIRHVVLDRFVAVEASNLSTSCKSTEEDYCRTPSANNNAQASSLLIVIDKIPGDKGKTCATHVTVASTPWCCVG